MRRGAVLEVVVNAFFFTQALDEMQVRFVVLHAVDTLGVDRTGLEFIGIALDAMFLEDLADDFRHAEVLEDPLVDAVCQIRQLRAQGHGVARQAFAGVALRGAVDQAVDAAAVGRQLQKGRLVQQGFEVQRRLLTDQLHLEGKRLADGFPTGEGKHLEIGGKPFDGQGKVGFIGRREHPLFLVLYSGARRPEKPVNAREILEGRKQHRPAELADA